MQNTELIPVKECCSNYNIEFNFLQLLHEHGLIEVVNIQQEYYLNTETLNDLEKLLRLHFDLNINLEGIEAVYNLLYKVKTMQQQIMHLENKLKLYEGSKGV